MKFSCDDCPYLEPDCPSNECTAFDMWLWEETCDDS